MTEPFTIAGSKISHDRLEKNWGGWIGVAIETDSGLAQRAANIVQADPRDGWRRLGPGDIVRMARWVRR
jgi:hypothetical protein